MLPLLLLLLLLFPQNTEVTTQTSQRIFCLGEGREGGRVGERNGREGRRVGGKNEGREEERPSNGASKATVEEPTG